MLGVAGRVAMSVISDPAAKRREQIAEAERKVAEDKYKEIREEFFRTPLGSPDLKKKVRSLSAALAEAVEAASKADGVYHAHSNSV